MCRDVKENAMDFGTPEMIEIRSMAVTVSSDGKHAAVTCVLPNAGGVRLKMDRSVLEVFCMRATEEMARHPKRASRYG